MISRYEVPEISVLWSEESRFKKLLQVEMALLQTFEELKIAPAGSVSAFKSVKINTARISEIESKTRHDVIAFCTSITEQVSPEFSKLFHFGVTSSDILDTALSLQIKESLEIIVSQLKELLGACDQQINQTKDLLCLGRSHGMAAEPMVFAQKFLSARAEFTRRLKEYQRAITEELTGQLSGAVGNYSILTPEIEVLTLKKLGLPVETVSTQVIPRDRIAKIVSIGALTASALERLAVELRHLHHSDVSEVHEGFKVGQKGSSTMPHKKNPISSENITGMARVIRSHLEIALQNVVLWHERDISHSSTERLYLPDHFGLLSYSIKRMTDTLLNLEVHREHIEEKIKKHFSTLSSLVLHELIKQNSTSREELYELVQGAFFEANTFDEMLTALQSQLTEKKLKGDLSKISWSSIRSNYIKRFEEILKRET